MSTMPQEQSSSLDEQKTASAVPRAGTAILIHPRDDKLHKDFHAELTKTLSEFGQVNGIESYKIPYLSPFTKGDQKVAIVFMENTTDANKAAAELDGDSIDGSTVSTEVLKDWQLINVRAGKWDQRRPLTFVTEMRRLKTKLRDKIDDEQLGLEVPSGNRLWE